MVNNQMIREKVAEVQAKGQEDKKWWEEQRKSIRSQFMKELDEDAGIPNASKNAPGSPDKIGTSDEDAVLVEGGGPASGTTTPGGGTTKKKKKNKGKK